MKITSFLFNRKAQHISTTYLVVIILVVMMGLALLFVIFKLRGRLLP